MEANNDTDICDDDDDDVFVYANELADIGCGSGAFNTTEQHIWTAYLSALSAVDPSELAGH